MRSLLPYLLLYFYSASSQLVQTPINTAIDLKPGDYLKYSINETAADMAIYYMTKDGTTAFFVGVGTPRKFPDGGYYRNLTLNSTRDNSTVGGLSWLDQVNCLVLPTPSISFNFTVLYQENQWMVCGQGIKDYCSYTPEFFYLFPPRMVSRLAVTSLNVEKIRLCDSPDCVCY